MYFMYVYTRGQGGFAEGYHKERAGERNGVKESHDKPCDELCRAVGAQKGGMDGWIEWCGVVWCG